MSLLNECLRIGAKISTIATLVGFLSATAATAQDCTNVAAAGNWTTAFNANNNQGGFKCATGNPDPECQVLTDMQACCAGATSAGSAAQIQCAVDVCNANDPGAISTLAVNFPYVVCD